MLLSDFWRLSVAYIGHESRTERPRKTKIGTEVAHITRDSNTNFKVTRPLCSPPRRVRRLQRWAWERVGRWKLLLRCRLLGGARRVGAQGERGGGIPWRPPTYSLLKQRMMEVVVTTGAISRAKLQPNRHTNKPTPSFFTGRMLFLSPNQQCQSIEWKISHSMDFHGVFQLCLWPLTAPGCLAGGLPCLSHGKSPGSYYRQLQALVENVFVLSVPVQLAH